MPHKSPAESDWIQGKRLKIHIQLHLFDLFGSFDPEGYYCRVDNKWRRQPLKNDDRDAINQIGERFKDLSCDGKLAITTQIEMFVDEGFDTFRVTVQDGQGRKATGHAIYFYDAIYMATAKLTEEDDAIKIVSVPVSAEIITALVPVDAPTVKVDASKIVIKM